jgi:tannase/feruloyl esterase
MRSRFRLAYVVAAALVLVAAVIAGTSVASPSRQAGTADAARPASIGASVAAPCASLTTLSLPNTTINSAVDTPAGAPGASVPRTCRVHATVNTPGVTDEIGIDVWMPVEGWNGRFQGVGGGGYSTGSPNSLAGPVTAGYSAASTDGGHTGASSFTGSFALDSAGRLNWPLIQDFAYRALHDLAVVGKAVTAAFYGRKARFSYWNGCSTGGRQGLSEAQRYPADYDGILAAAPAINWQKFIPAELWPQLVMLQAGNFLPQCKFAAFQAAAIQACDTAGDRVADGVIGDPFACRFDPSSLVGTSTPCGTITAQDANVVSRIVNGPRTTTGDFLWYGLTWGSSFGGLANTTATGGAPFPIALAHLGTWVQQTPPVPAGTWDWTTTTHERYEQLFQQSVEMYSDVIGTDNPDLSGFKKAGGKLIVWHGLVDQLIFPQGTTDYYERVTDELGGSSKTEKFARLFLAPGVAHCAGGPGPQPDNPLNALIEWVERGKAPDTLNAVVRNAAGVVTQSRPLCLYPRVAAYKGRGDPMSAANFVCRDTKRDHDRHDDDD